MYCPPGLRTSHGCTCQAGVNWTIRDNKNLDASTKKKIRLLLCSSLRVFSTLTAPVWGQFHSKLQIPKHFVTLVPGGQIQCICTHLCLDQDTPVSQASIRLYLSFEGRSCRVQVGCILNFYQVLLCS